MSKTISVSVDLDIGVDKLVDSLYSSGNMDVDVAFLNEYFGSGQYWKNEYEIDELADGINQQTQAFFLEFADRIRKSREDRKET